MSNTSPPSLHMGCAVWAYRGFIGNLYPESTTERDLLPLYVDRLTAVEGNTTFYALPPKDTILKWKAHMPEGFAFCPKLDRRITHEGSLLDHKKLSMLVLKRLKHFGAHLGPILMQMPPSFGPASFQELKRYLMWWPHEEAELALEVRHAGWWQEAPELALNELCSELGVGRVLLDTRAIFSSEDNPQELSERKKPRVPMHPVVTAPFTMVRFITHPDPQYTAEYLQEWIEQVTQWLEEGTRVYFFSHCPIEERSPDYAREIYHGVAARIEHLAPLPWDTVKLPPTQLGLF